MIALFRENHDPRRNSAILAEITNQFDLTKAIQETEQLFNKIRVSKTSHRGKDGNHSTGTLSQKMAAFFFAFYPPIQLPILVEGLK